MAGISPRSTRPSCSSDAQTAGTSNRTVKRSGRSSRPLTRGLVFKYDTAPETGGSHAASPGSAGREAGRRDVAPHVLESWRGGARAWDRPPARRDRGGWRRTSAPPAPASARTAASPLRSARSIGSAEARERDQPDVVIAGRRRGDRLLPRQRREAANRRIRLDDAPGAQQQRTRAPRRASLHRQASPGRGPRRRTAATSAGRHQVDGRLRQGVEPGRLGTRPASLRADRPSPARSARPARIRSGESPGRLRRAVLGDAGDGLLERTSPAPSTAPRWPQPAPPCPSHPASGSAPTLSTRA